MKRLVNTGFKIGLAKFPFFCLFVCLCLGVALPVQLHPQTLSLSTPTNINHASFGTSCIQSRNLSWLCYALDTCGARNLVLFCS